MKNTIKLIIIYTIVAISSCVGVKHTSENKWKWLAFFLPKSSSSFSSVALGMTLIGADGKPLSIGNASVKSTSEIKEDSAKPAEDSNVPPVGGSYYTGFLNSATTGNLGQGKVIITFQ